MSMDKTNGDVNVFVFAKGGVTVNMEEDMLITRKGASILIGVRAEQGRYCILLVQQRGQWRPRKPLKAAQEQL